MPKTVDRMFGRIIAQEPEDAITTYVHAVHAYALTTGKDRSSSGEQQLVQRQIIHKQTSVISQLHTIRPEIDLNIAHTFVYM